jgi:hypothetical protein
MKARTARHMLFKCLALEKPQLRVLNYEPGIVYTDMLKDAYESSEMFPEQFKRNDFILSFLIAVSPSYSLSKRLHWFRQH